MIQIGETRCPKCNGELRYYDKVRRIVRGRYGRKNYIFLSRFRCSCCGATHREFNNDIVPYKRYEREIIFGVIEGLITCETLGFEDYPCELTMIYWKAQKIQII